MASAAGAAWLCLQAEMTPAPALWMRGLALLLALVPLARLRSADSAPARIAGVAAAVFLLTGVATIGDVYDITPAIAKLLMLCGGLGLAVGFATQTPDRLARATGLFAAASVGLSVYFIATNDWFAPPVKYPWLAEIGAALSRPLPRVPGPRIHPNIVAGILGSLLPWFALVQPSLSTRAPRAVVLAAGTIVCGALMLTSSRGAWMAIGLVLIAVLAIRLRAGRAPSSVAAKRVAWTSAAVVAIGMATVLLFVNKSGVWGEALGKYGRLSVQGRALTLVRDYGLSGMGLSSFPLQFSVYAQVVTSKTSVHAHNLFLDLTIEQGVTGLVSFLVLMLTGVIAASFGRRSPDRRVRLASSCALASMAIIALHGLFDDTLYASRGAVVLFVPLGVALGCAVRTAERWTMVRPGRWMLSLGAAAVAVVVWVATTGVGRAAWQADLGALQQARAELPQLDPTHLDKPTLDQVRRRTDLNAAIARFDAAARLRQNDGTAARRRTAIALSRGEYGEALTMIQAARAAGDNDYATRALEGDALVANGRVDEAASLLSDDLFAVDRLLSIAWYRYWLAQDRTRAMDAWRTVLLLDANNKVAVDWLTVARTRPEWTNR